MDVKTRQEKTDFGTVWFVNDTENTFRFALYQYDDDLDSIYLSNVFVSKKYRGKGIGNSILSSAEKIAKIKNANKIFLKVKKGSFANYWYERHGYSYFSNHRNGYIWMIKNI
jgi:GNAT superfamily N-acetyltransferase